MYDDVVHSIVSGRKRLGELTLISEKLRSVRAGFR